MANFNETELTAIDYLTFWLTTNFTQEQISKILACALVDAVKTNETFALWSGVPRKQLADRERLNVVKQESKDLANQWLTLDLPDNF